MALLSPRMKEIFSNQKTFVLGTSDRGGNPNTVPVAAVKILDDETILVSDQFFVKTLSNLRENPKAALSFWDKDSGEGYQVKGAAAIHTAGKIFEETAEWVHALSLKAGHPFQSKGAVVIRIGEIYSVTPGPDAGKKIG